MTAELLTGAGSSLRARADHQRLAVARDVLSEFVVDRAERTASEVGFAWAGTTSAPDTYDRLTVSYERSVATGLPLPVSAEHSDHTIYTHPDVNLAMRFWHDVNHVRRELTFELVDELELGLWHLDQCAAAGFGEDTAVWQLLHADLIGQATVMAYSRRFPLDQQRFAATCVNEGFDRGLLDELRRSP